MLGRITLWCYICLLLQDAVQGSYRQAGDVAEKVDLHYEDKRLYHIKKDPMKIIVHYDTSIDRMDKADEAIIKCSLIPAAVEWVSKAIKVHKSHSKFLLERQCLNNFHYLINGRKYCQNGCMAETKCGPVTIPEKHLHGCNSCSSGTDCTTRPSNEKHTLKGDFVLYVSSLPDLLCQRYYLSASHCQQEKDFDRPVAGYLNFCPNLLINAPAAYDSLLSVVMHELFHMLAFSYELLPYFHDEQGFPRTARDSSGIPITEGHWSSRNYKVNGASLTKITKQKWTTVNNISQTVTFVSTPHVQREVQQHFQCDSMIGAEVENQEQSIRGTIHWEKRLFGNELMTADYHPNSVISRITLALIEDSGWYKVNYTYAGRLSWGQGRGCAFVNSTCGEWIQHSRSRNQNPSPFCDGKSQQSAGDYSCTINHKAIASCNMKNFSYLPTEYQYFINNIFVGGSLPSADYCPFNEEIRSLGQFLQCNNIYAPKGVKYIVGLESYGPKSACFEHGEKWVQKISHKKKEEVIETQRRWGAGCYEYRCTENGVVITVGNSHFECKTAGKIIRISTKYDGLIYEGSLVCPEYDKLCQDHGCSNMCSRHGSCVNNTCYCDPGFYGHDCRYSYKAKSMPCNELTCKNGGTCINDGNMCGIKCNCLPQYTGTYCEQENLCEQVENYCNGHGECTISSDYSTAVCLCHEGFNGTRCDVEQDYCTLHGNPCQNGATCVSSNTNSFYCRCPGRYSGALCENSETDFCDAQPCKNGGTCINRRNGFSCQCTEQYTGKRCKHLVNDHCTPNPCQNGGICTQNTTGFICNCLPPFSGVICTIKEESTPYSFRQCTTDQCLNGGTCTKHEGKFYCACLQGYTGRNCETQINHCSKTVCQNGTQCKTNNSTNTSSTCECSGINCNRSNTCDTRCLNGGMCIETENGYQCNCTSPYFGQRCEKDPCNPSPCRNGGKCSMRGGKFECHCPPMFGGKRCKKLYTPQSMPCPVQICDNGGVCKISVNNTQQCKCPPHLEGFQCSKEKNPCLNHECKNNAKCIPVNHNDYLCNCSNGFKGKNCEQSDQCNDCKTNPCKNGGECVCYGDNGYQCRCPKGFEGDQCQLETQSYTMPQCPSCPNNTNCTANTTSSCACRRGYTGYKCEERVSCLSKPCQNGGTCIDTDKGFNCSCPIGFTGEICNTSLDTPRCLNGGVQITVIHGIEMCICMQGFTGEVCQYHDNNTSPCVPNKCIHGSCVVRDNAYMCQCSEGFTGKHCDEPDYCMLGYCMNGATCVYNDDHTFNCLCAEDFHGAFCTISKE